VGLTPLLPLFIAGPRIAHAGGEPDSGAAMAARVSSEVVRVVTMRPRNNDEANSGAKLANATVTDGTNTFTCSEFFIDPSGYFGTDKHVVDGVISVSVVTSEGVRYAARVVGMPDKADMALLRIDAGHDLPFVQFGDSDDVRVGDKVFAIGSPFGFDNTVTSRIISGSVLLPHIWKPAEQIVIGSHALRRD
jgi:S1-C subfamily serine protease